MLLGSRSTVLVIVTVFGLLFSLLYASTVIANQHSDALFAILESKKAEASLFRLKNPEPVCFTLHDISPGDHPFLMDLIKQADSMADSPEPSYDNLTNRYDGFANGVDAADVLPIIREHQDKFNHTIEIVSIRQYADERHTYDCNFDYKGNQYYLDIKFQSLTALNERDGFVSIDITSDAKAGISDILTFNTFNNTAIWINHLESFVNLTLQTEMEEQQFTVSARIPPGKSWDYRLYIDHSRMEDTIYHYQIKESGKGTTLMSGDIGVRHYPPCMSQEIAKSLYSQSGVKMKYPAYLPQGDYRYVCGIHFSNSDLIQAYWNQTVANPLEDSFGESKDYTFINFAFHSDGLDSGIIQVIGGKTGILARDTDAQGRYDEIRNMNYYLDTQLVTIENLYDGSEYHAVAYRHNIFVEKDINILEVYDENGEYYFFRGKVPLSELVKMAESLRE